MSKYVPDISSRRWVIVSPQRMDRPHDHKGQKHVCQICEGHEDLTPPEVLRYGGGEVNKQGWKVRVIPNKFPVTDLHEVFIHCPNCGPSFEDLPVSQLQLIFMAYRERFRFYKDKGQIYIFCNQGINSGASLKHSHAQLVVIPTQINVDVLLREPLSNIVDENNFFNIYCPEFSQWPYEVWLTPKTQNSIFSDINDEEIKDLVALLRKTIRSLKKIHDKGEFNKEMFSYNFYIYPKENWYLRLIPRFIHRAGFELGTGLSVNPVDPIQAAKDLREHSI